MTVPFKAIDKLKITDNPFAGDRSKLNMSPNAKPNFLITAYGNESGVQVKFFDEKEVENLASAYLEVYIYIYGCVL